MKKLVFVFVAVLVLGCGPMPYPVCHTIHEERCNGDVVEICDGEHWEPDMDCSRDLAAPGGVQVVKRCAEVEPGVAQCEEVAQ